MWAGGVVPVGLFAHPERRATIESISPEWSHSYAYSCSLSCIWRVIGRPRALGLGSGGGRRFWGGIERQCGSDPKHRPINGCGLILYKEP